jgi:uncharacterized membrane protein
MSQLNVLFGNPLVVLLVVSAVLCGLMAGFFFAYSVSVVLALESLSGSEYIPVMQEINEKVLNIIFGTVFFGAVVVPIGGTILIVLREALATQYGQLFLIGTIIYVVGTFLVTVRIHIPMNNRIATWSSTSPPDEWTTVRARWRRWNHIRAAAAVISFVFYLTAVLSLSG